MKEKVCLRGNKKPIWHMNDYAVLSPGDSKEMRVKEHGNKNGEDMRNRREKACSLYKKR